MDHGSIKIFVHRVGIEPTTPWASAKCSTSELSVETTESFALLAVGEGFEPPSFELTARRFNH